MTVAQLVVVPGIILSLLAAGLLAIAARVAARYCRALSAQRAAALAPVSLLREQGSVITDVIAELAGSPMAREGLSEDVQLRLMRAHEHFSEKPQVKKGR